LYTAQKTTVTKQAGYQLTGVLYSIQPLF